MSCFQLSLFLRAAAGLQPGRGRRRQDHQGVVRAVSQREGQEDGLVAGGGGPRQEDTPLESGQVSDYVLIHLALRFKEVRLGVLLEFLTASLFSN